MVKVTIDEFQRDLTEYLHWVKAGETLVLIDENEPVAEIKPVASSKEHLRPYALCTEEFRCPDDFDAPLPDEILAQFEGS